MAGARSGHPKPTKGRIPDEAIGPDGQLDATKVPDFVPVLDQAGDIAGYAAYRDLDVGDRIVPWWYQDPPTPVYAGDLRTLVGLMFPGKGFVPLSGDPVTVPESPAVVAPGPSPSSSATSTVTDGPFTLTFTVPQTIWSTADAIEGTATLSAASDHAIGLSGSGDGLIGFAYTSARGSRSTGTFWHSDCAPYTLAPDVPIVSPLGKSGAYDPQGPDAAFYQAFFADPVVHLLAGGWDVSAYASFIDGEDCRGEHRWLTAVLRIEVVE